LRELRGVLETKREGDDVVDGEGHEDGRGRAVIYSPMFNSGAFKVPWSKTEELIMEVFDGWTGAWIVLAPP
jgi:ADP-ribose 1''-phosphate phosphatase